jgi:hypothetical protein
MLVPSILPTTANQLGQLKVVSEFMLSPKVCGWENGEIEDETCNPTMLQYDFQNIISTLFLSTTLNTTSLMAHEYNIITTCFQPPHMQCHR